MPLMKQKIAGKQVKTLDVDGSADDILALQSLMEGEISIYDKKFEGGTASPLPSALNAKSFSVGKKTGKATFSASVRIPHVKPSLTFSEIRAMVIGSFDQDYTTAVKCEYSNMFYDKN